MMASVSLRICILPMLFFAMAYMSASAQIDMSGGFDTKNPEHVDWAVPKIVAIFEPEIDRIESCVAMTRIYLAGVGKEDVNGWAAIDYINRVWEAELKSAVDGGEASLLQLYNANRRVDWPEHLLTYDMHKKFLSRSMQCGSEVSDVLDYLDWSEFE